MKSSPFRSRSERFLLRSVLFLFAISSSAQAADDGNVLYLSEYLHGDYYHAELPDMDRANPGYIRAWKLRLPGRFRSRVQLGNHDVSATGRHIVFAAHSKADQEWDIYRGTIDLARSRIVNVEQLTATAGTRDEDPRFSWDGSQIVYKCDGNICVYPDGIYASPVVESACELWAPSFDLSGYRIAYGRRCGDPADDTIGYYDLLTGTEAAVPGTPGSPDRFARFLDDGGIVYSHLDGAAGRASLWQFAGGRPTLLHDRTESDDDPYPDRHDPNHIAFIGWQGDGYDLFILRRDRGDSVQITRDTPVLAPVLFR